MADTKGSSRVATARARTTVRQNICGLLNKCRKPKYHAGQISVFNVNLRPYVVRIRTTQSGFTRPSQQSRQQVVETNYTLGRKFYSYAILRRKLRSLVTNFTGLDNL